MDRNAGEGEPSNTESEASLPEHVRLGRRRLIQALLASATVGGVNLLIPHSWLAPLVSLGVLPAQAASGEGGAGGANANGGGGAGANGGAPPGNGGAGGVPPEGGNGGTGGEGGAPPAGDKRLFVAGQRGGTAASVRSFPFDATMASAVVTAVGGDLQYTQQIAAHGNDFIVGSYGATPPAVSTYALTADADTPPVRTITGAPTGLTYPFGVLVIDEGGANDGIYVGDNGSVRVFPINQNDGSAPVRVIEGASTTLGQVRHLARNGTELLVRVDGRLLGFPLGGGGAPGSPAANIAPTRDLTVGILGNGGVAVFSNEIYVVCGGAAAYSIHVYAIDADDNDLPIRTIGDLASNPAGLDQPAGCVIDDGLIYVANMEQHEVRVFDAKAPKDSGPLRILPVPSGTFPYGVMIASVG